MTREEAKEFFEDPHVNYQTHGYYTEEEEIEANNWAISALSTDGEYIKKEDAIKAFEKSLLGKYILWDTQEVIKKDMQERISQLHTYSIPNSAENKGEWIPINDIEDIPKSGSYWVTMDFVFSIDVEKIRWSDAWRCWVDYDTDDVLTKESASLIIAYMPYIEPEPYK